MTEQRKSRDEQIAELANAICARATRIKNVTRIYHEKAHTIAQKVAGCLPLSEKRLIGGAISEDEINAYTNQIDQLDTLIGEQENARARLMDLTLTAFEDSKERDDNSKERDE